MRTLILLLGCVLFISCTPKKETQPNVNKVEFDLLCDQFSAMVKSPDFKTLDSEQRGEKLHQILAVKLDAKGNAFLAWDAIRFGPPELRYTLFKESASSVGYTDWSCSAIEAHGNEVGVLP